VDRDDYRPEDFQESKDPERKKICRHSGKVTADFVALPQILTST